MLTFFFLLYMLNIYMIFMCVHAAGCLCGGLCCVSQRITQHTAVWLTKVCIQPTSLCMRSTPSRVISYRGDCRGSLCSQTSNYQSLSSLLLLCLLHSFKFLNNLVVSTPLQGFVCISSLGSHLWRGGVSSPGSLSFCQALPEQPNALLWGGGHCHRYLMVAIMMSHVLS